MSDIERYTSNLQAMIRQKTVSDYNERDAQRFREFRVMLKQLFPSIFEVCTYEEFDGSILMKWQGRSSETPILLMAHYDVVDVSDDWTHDPFGAEISDGKMWGRGLLDNKGSLWCMLQAADDLAKEGFVPEHDVYFESANTEETTGEGAKAIAEELKKRGLHFKFILDEGGMIVHDPIGGADGDFAMVGVGQKCASDVKFIALSNGGHASTPPKDTPLVRLGKFMAEVDKSKIFESRLSPTVQEMFRRIAPSTKGAMKVLFGNLGFFRHVAQSLLPKVSSSAAAMFRTTVAFTMAEGSKGRNVIPDHAWVNANIRTSHHQGVDGSFKALERVAAKYDIQMEIVDRGIESRVSDYKGEGFSLVELAVKEVYPGLCSVPYIQTGASDIRFFSDLSEQCLGFAPFKIDSTQLASVHGLDESLDVSCLEPAVKFIKCLIRKA